MFFTAMEYNEPVSSMTWDASSGKYTYSTHGNTEVLVIAPSFSDHSLEVVPRRPQEELREDEQRKLEHHEMNRDCHHDDPSTMKARHVHGLDRERNISKVMTGDFLTCEQVTEKITRLLSRTRAAGGNPLLSSLCAIYSTEVYIFYIIMQ